MSNRFKKSIVWEFFDKTLENHKVVSVQCKNCNAKYKYFGNTTNLHDHLRRKHPIQLMDLQVQHNPNENSSLDTPSSAPSNTPRPVAAVHSIVPTSSSSQPTTTTTLKDRAPPAKRIRQLRLYGTTQNSEPTDDERCEFQRDLIHMIAVDCQPLSVVENRGFNFFINKYMPRHKLPSRKVLSEKVLPEVYQSLSSSLKGMLDKTEYISITTDMWSSDSNRAYITVTAHFVYEFKIRSLALSTEEVKTDHSAVNIAQAISNIFSKWQITNKIVTVVTDNAANMKKAVSENLRKYHHPCVAHTLNLSVQDTIKENQELQNLITKCRSLVTYFKQSNLAAYKLREVQDQMGLQELKLKQDVPTRWNSVVIMMERLSQMKLPLSATLSSLVNAPENLDASEWTTIDDCVQLLKLLLLMTEDLSGEMYPTMSRITPLIRGLQYQIKNKNITTDIGKELQLSLLDVISRRLGCLETNKTVAKSTFLDPRFKKAAFGTEVNADNAQQWVTNDLRKLIHSSQSADNSNSDDTQFPNPSTASSSNLTQHDEEQLWIHFDERVTSITSAVSPDACAILIIKQYLELPYLDRKKDPLDFWKLHVNMFPQLYVLASKYLSIPATSVPSERIFSKAAMITNDRRNRLAPKKLDELLFISENADLVTKQ